MTKRPPFQIKICGITRAADLVASVRAGADAIGINFFGGSPRFLSLDQAPIVLQSARDLCLTEQLKWPLVVGVFVNSDLAEIAQTVAACKLDSVQFHGDERPDAVTRLKGILRNSATVAARDVIVIRALRFPAATGPLDRPRNADLALAPQSPQDGRHGNVIEEIQAWVQAGTDAILLDAAVEGAFGGSGKTLDWGAVRELNLNQDLVVPLILAGGLTPRNVAQAILATGVQSVDVASGVESAVGIKSEPLLKSFVNSTGWHH